MKDFSKKIKADWNFFAEFFFHQLHTVTGQQRWHVSVKDIQGHSIFFNMEQRSNGSWKIVNAPKVPDWIMDLETVLNNSILENLAA